MTKLLVAAAVALMAAAPAFADDKAGGCENCAHHKAMAAKADGAKADAKAPADAKAAPAATACACKKGDPNAKCSCAPGACACAQAAGHGEPGHDCANCAHHGKAPKGATKT
ncbi:MAG TPA: hypothetical protein VD838_17530 [Anaeromyxobacteraceae bacterium]|nr:hypothetical protein [Anaeromyxobacteraceae bacterium]